MKFALKGLLSGRAAIERGHRHYVKVKHTLKRWEQINLSVSEGGYGRFCLLWRVESKQVKKLKMQNLQKLGGGHGNKLFQAWQMAKA